MKYGSTAYPPLASTPYPAAASSGVSSPLPSASDRPRGSLSASIPNFAMWSRAKSMPISRSSRMETRLRDLNSAVRRGVGPKNLPL